MKVIILTAAIIGMTLGLFSTAVAQKCNKKEACKANKKKFGKTEMRRDADFAMEAAEGGIMEILLGKLAETNASSMDVKELGRDMVTDHNVANEELEALAKRKNISLPTALTRNKEKVYDRFTRKKGKKFDKCYTRYMVKDHKRDIKCFKKEADKGNDAEMKAWAKGKVPVLERHLDLAKNACEAVKKEK